MEKKKKREKGGEERCKAMWCTSMVATYPSHPRQDAEVCLLGRQSFPEGPEEKPQLRAGLQRGGRGRVVSAPLSPISYFPGVKTHHLGN